MPRHARPPTPPSSRTSTRRTDARLESYKAFLRIPSISALPEHADDCRAAAEWLADALTAAGLEHAEVVETGGHPIVYADWLHAPGAPTVLVYGHYDVQPVDPLDLWTSPPFEPVVVGDRILARGAADDKGQVHAHVHGRRGAAARPAAACRSTSSSSSRARRSPSSVHLDALARGRTRAARRRRRDHQRHRLLRGQPAGDHARPARPDVRPDRRGRDRRSTSTRAATAAPSRTRPTRWPRSSPRSRAPTAGSASPASTTTSSPLTEADRAALAALPFDEEAYREQLGLPALVGEVGFTTLERRGARPTLDVNGIWGGFQGEGSKTIIPAHAHAKVSCRLVADQDPDRIFEAFRGLRRGDRPARRDDDRPVPRWRPPEPDADGPPGDAGRRAGARGDVRRGAGLHPRGRLDPGLRQLRVDPRPAGRAARASRQPDEQRPRAERVDGPRQLRDGHPGHRPDVGRAGRTCRADGPPRGLCGNGTFGWVFGPNVGATMRPTQPSGRIQSREHRRSRRRHTERRRPTTAAHDATPGHADLAPRHRQRQPEARVRRSTCWSTSTTRSRPARSREYQPVPLGFTPLDKTIGTRPARRRAAAHRRRAGHRQDDDGPPDGAQRRVRRPGQRPVHLLRARRAVPAQPADRDGVGARPPARTRPARSRSRTSARRSSGPGWPRARRTPRWPTTRGCARRWTASRATARTCS